ncbi:MAG: hypothetical protein U9O98_06825 [Asgard group archaeon]|nr:hypothetical protein [Asgard group archaeon]
MAIQTVWIIDSESGICIYDWYAIHDPNIINEQLISGLLIAFKNFSSEAGLVEISAIEGLTKKLAYQTKGKYIIAAICNRRDYEPLINKTLLKIINKFTTKFKQALEDFSMDVSQFHVFDTELEKVLEGNTAPRNFFSTFGGTMASLAVLAGVFIGFLFGLKPLAGIIGQETTDILTFVILLLGIFLANLLGGYITGERRLSFISSEAAVLPLIGILIYINQGNWGGISNKLFFSLLYLVIFSAVALLGGLLGGFLKERRYFVPIVKEQTEQLEEE